MVEVTADSATLGRASLDCQFQAATQAAALGLLGIAGRSDLQTATTFQQGIADLGFTAADTRAFQYKVCLTAQMHSALGIDLRDLRLGLRAVLLVVIQVATGVDAGAAGAVADLGPGIAVKLL
ncbi:hypothetical protein D3C80_1347650 [compost metagenome]